MNEDYTYAVITISYKESNKGLRKDNIKLNDVNNY